MHFKIPHKTTKADARQKVQHALDDARPHMEGQVTITEEKWEGDAFHFAVDLQGKTITGKLEITDTEFILDAKLPLLWRMFEGRIEKEIAKQVALLK